MSRLTVMATGVCCALLLLAAGPARAGGLSPVVADCNANGTLTQTYPVVQLRNALATMPADIAEYSDCHDVIEHQLLAQLGGFGGGGGGGGGGGSFLPAGVASILVLLGLAASAYAGLIVRRRRAA